MRKSHFVRLKSYSVENSKPNLLTHTTVLVISKNCNLISFDALVDPIYLN